MSRSTAKRAFRQARELAARGETGEAAALYRAILREFPDDREARAALDGLRPAQVDPPLATLRALAGLYGSGQVAALERECRVLLRRFPGSFRLWGLLGAAHQRLGRMEEALADLGKAVELNPGDAQGHYNLGVVCHMLGRLGEAEAAYRAGIAVNPGHADALNNLGHVLNEGERFSEAADVLRRAVAARRGFWSAENNLGNALHGLGEDAAALEAYRRALSANPEDAQAHGNIGALLVEAGRFDEARAALERALEIRPDDTAAFLNLCRVRRFENGDPLLARMEALHAAGRLGAEERSSLCFALAEVRERRGETERAFGLLSEANALRKRLIGYDIGQDRGIFAAIRAAAPAVDAARVVPEAAAPVRPIFILGMPRSGTTLVEQIVSAHPDVAAGGELQHVWRLGAEIAMGRAPETAEAGTAEAGTAEAVSAFRRGYLDRIGAIGERQGYGGLAFVTDKMPQNFLFIGLIAAALPEAKILHVSRAPEAVCWSNFRQHFTGRGMGYSHDLGDVVAYYRMYRELMELWRARHPGLVVEVDYEALVADQEAETRGMIAALGLAWSDACLAPEENARAVRTASKLQVREAVYRGASQKWREYAPYLGGAFDGLAGL